MAHVARKKINSLQAYLKFDYKIKFPLSRASFPRDGGLRFVAHFLSSAAPMKRDWR